MQLERREKRGETDREGGESRGDSGRGRRENRERVRRAS
jgi:hypothetical protein